MVPLTPHHPKARRLGIKHPGNARDFDTRHLAYLHRQEGNILVVGILTASAGLMFFCNVVVANGISWAVIGLILCTTSLLQGITASQLRETPQLLSWSAMTVFYLAFGLFALTGLSARFTALSLVFFAGVAVIGVLRSYCGYILQFATGWRWLAAGGMATLAIGSSLMLKWPVQELQLTGTLLAVDLMSYGASQIGFSLRLGDGRTDNPRK